MGFRFRRQVKIFPGIRWNIAKNNLFSSLTFGSPKSLFKVNVPLGRPGPAKMTLGNFGGLLTGLSYETSLGGSRGLHNPNALSEDQNARLEKLKEEQAKRRKHLGL